MHELFLAQNILKLALDEAAEYPGKSIKSLSISLGEGSGMEQSALEFLLQALSKGTIAEKAKITIQPLAGTSVITLDSLNLEEEVTKTTTMKEGGNERDR